MRAMPFVSLVVYALLAAAPAEAGPATDVVSNPAAIKHVRPRDSAATLLLRFGNERSARFRDIVRTLEASNVVVYVEVRQDSDYPVSGGLTFMGEAHGIRWVRARVDSGTPSYIRTCQDIVRLTAILGHELQHALEASQAASLSDVDEFKQYFRSIGVDEGPEVLDTQAARDAGKLVADELRGMTHRGDDVTLAATQSGPAIDKARAVTGS